MTLPPARRPRLHLSTPAGWINDPHGVTWHGHRYHVYFQYVPGSTVWSPRMSWGHASGRDLLTWDDDVEVALAPGEGDDGCWSGALVLDGHRPTILYTSWVAGEGSNGRIALAFGDGQLRTWTKLGRPVLDAPAGVIEFRDPTVARDGTSWRMVVGCRVDGAAAALLFRSLDLHRWSTGSVLCQRRADPTDPVPTGDAWECVQFIQVHGAWVLIASAWTQRVDDGVVYAVGSFDGSTFSPRSWRRLDHGGALYATTTFRDADDQWCALSWVREAEPAHPNRTRAGAMSLPHRLAVDGDRLVITPHPDLDHRRGEDLAPDDPLPAQCDVELTVTAPVDVGGLLLDHDGDRLLLRTGPDSTRAMPVPAGTRVRVVLDEDIAEIYAGGEIAVLRVPDRSDRPIGAAADVRVRLISSSAPMAHPPPT